MEDVRFWLSYRGRWPFRLVVTLLVTLALQAAPAWATSEYAATRITWKRGYHPISIRARDGDTAYATLKGGVRHIRILGIDTPELNVACQKVRAVAARDALQALLDGGGRVIVREAHQHDKYGRPLGQIVVGTVNVAEALVASGKAKPYDGGKRPTWC